MDDRRIIPLVKNPTMIKNFLKLIRWPNLLVVTITMGFMLVFLIHPLLGTPVFKSGLTLLEFIMLTASVLLITMGGYIVNDLSDVNPDSVNKPGKNLIGEKFSTSAATQLYWITTFAGLALGTLFSYHLKQINYSLIFVFTAGLLWFYSSKYKCQPLVGNMVVAVLSSLSFVLVWLFSFFALSNQAQVFTAAQSTFPLITRIVFIYAAFAFLVTLFREIVKDLEDFSGDYRYGCRTLPVAYGTGVAKVAALITGYLTVAGMAWAGWFFFKSGHHWLAGWFVLMVLALLAMLLKLHQADEKKEFSKLSLYSKLLMIMGILSMVIFYLEI